MYFFCCIGEFARKYSLTNAEAYKFLVEFKGMDFIDQQYEIEHTQSIEDAVEDMMLVCQRNGGVLAYGEGHCKTYCKP